MKLFEPPLRRPPVDPNKVKEMEEVIDFALHEFEYDEKDIENFKKEMKRKKVVKKEDAVAKDVQLDNSPYIKNLN